MGLKLCDKCFRSGEYKPGPCVVVIGGIEEYDLCKSCEEELRNMINTEKKQVKRKGRPPKAAKQQPKERA